jgi:hypothetical protein
VRKNRAGQHRWTTDNDVVELITVLARQMADKAIASLLNGAGKTTGHGNGWTSSRVCFLRNHCKIPPYREGERAERGEVTLAEAAAHLKIGEATVRRLIYELILPANQLCKGAPWGSVPMISAWIVPAAPLMLVACDIGLCRSSTKHPDFIKG